MIKIEKTKLAWKLTLPFQYHDERGSIYEPFDWEHRVRVKRHELGVVEILNNISFHKFSALDDKYKDLNWAQEKIIVERHGALRGLHSHSSAWLLMTCLHGDVVIGLLNPQTKEIEQFEFVVDHEDIYQILVPPGIANGHCALSSDSVFHYLWSSRYEDEKQETYKWNAYGIDWGIKEPILSERDR